MYLKVRVLEQTTFNLKLNSTMCYRGSVDSDWVVSTYVLNLVNIKLNFAVKGLYVILMEESAEYFALYCILKMRAIQFQ